MPVAKKSEPDGDFRVLLRPAPWSEEGDYKCFIEVCRALIQYLILDNWKPVPRQLDIFAISCNGLRQLSLSPVNFDTRSLLQRVGPNLQHLSARAIKMMKFYY